jgi:hypothetical protein
VILLTNNTENNVKFIAMPSLLHQVFAIKGEANA